MLERPDDRYGTGRHPAALNFGDCLACARYDRVPLHREQVLAFSPFLYKCRNLVERFFSKISTSELLPRSTTRIPTNSLASVKLAALRVGLRAL